MKSNIFSSLFLAAVLMSFVACSNESNEVTPAENLDIDPKLEQFSETEIDNMSATDLLEIELDQKLEQRTVTLTDEEGNSLNLLVAAENLNSIASYLTSKKLGLNGKIQTINLEDYDLPTENITRNTKVYVEFLQTEADLANKEMLLSVETIPSANGAQQRYDETDVYTSGTFIEGFDFTNQFFGPPAAVTRMKVSHYYKKNRFARYRFVASNVLDSGQSWFSCQDGRRTRAYIEHNSGQSDLYFFAFNNCS